MDQVDAYENDMMENEDENAESRKGCIDMLTLADVQVQPLDANPANNAGTSYDDDEEEDDDLNFLDDDLSG